MSNILENVRYDVKNWGVCIKLSSKLISLKMAAWKVGLIPL